MEGDFEWVQWRCDEVMCVVLEDTVAHWREREVSVRLMDNICLFTPQGDNFENKMYVYGFLYDNSIIDSGAKFFRTTEIEVQ